MSVEDPVPPDANVKLVGFRDAVSPLVEVRERETVPENALRLESVRVTVPEDPTGVLRLVVPGTRLKSGGGAPMVNVYVTDCVQLRGSTVELL